MKKFTLLTLFALFACGSMMAQKLTAEDVMFDLSIGNDAQLVINLESDKLPAGVDFNVILPEGISFKKNSSGKITLKSFVDSRGDVLTGDDAEDSNENHTISFTEIENGLNIVIADYNGGMFEKSTGTLVTFNLTVDDGCTPDDYKGKLTGIMISDYNGSLAPTFDDVEFNIAVTVGSGISDINREMLKNGSVYTIGGQRVTGNNLRKGVYVTNGKKMTVK